MGALKNNGAMLAELVRFLWKQKLWWLTPMIAMLILLGAIIMLGQSTAAGPFIYTLF